VTDRARVMPAMVAPPMDYAGVWECIENPAVTMTVDPQNPAGEYPVRIYEGGVLRLAGVRHPDTIHLYLVGWQFRRAE
jgi:hypothetical protein